ncbi:MAG: HPF/RaiA family ribosome-associated protein [Bacteroidales bacterium]|jgi:ribosomal subunit interface protein|nr:ribosome-associated translation inhibitor RaiA [Bacteroidales bacterium]MBO7229308.1 ribosome-associated translation inhibitor RaiA [Bacteroidales bacterium]MBQ2386870.1 ribosome-associated translation inhibitor RaiA [Bacteroidales bacterium]MEE0894900.1 HPF/RaiA family ribosome-associated protein [Bacteroidales bacterium]MEE0899585.1 HPF/RaiA family ribosome-associated protein [Bacteroidales bacterium]
MKVLLNAVKFSPDEKLKVFVEEKVGKVERLLPDALQAEVNLKVEKPETNNNKIAEIRIVVRGNDLFVSKQADSFEEAVMLAIDALKTQIDKFKEKK